jgi:hypothetical protein
MEQSAERREERGETRERRAKSGGQRASKERRVKSKERRAKSKEQGAKSKDGARSGLTRNDKAPSQSHRTNLSFPVPTHLARARYVAPSSASPSNPSGRSATGRACRRGRRSCSSSSSASIAARCRFRAALAPGRAMKFGISTKLWPIGGGDGRGGMRTNKRFAAHRFLKPS